MNDKTENTPTLSPQQQLKLTNPWQDKFYQISGVNRSARHSQIEADNDIEAINVWLNRVGSSKHTYRAYRKEIERLLLWGRRCHDKRLSDLTLEHIQLYLDFIKDPQPAEKWCNSTAKLARDHPNWRPFSKPLSDKSQAQAIRIISICFTFLVDAGYLIGNPCRLLTINKIAANDTSVVVERYLEQDLWDEFWQFITNLPKTTTKEINERARAIFLVQLLYLQSPRVSEVAKATMNGFGKQHGRWWWRVLGKGNKQASIPVSEEMLVALKTYRTHLGLSLFPTADDNSPLLRSISGAKGISADMVYRIVKNLVKQAALHIEKYNPDGAQKLKLASTHWFRHTSITHQADKKIDIRYIQASARHSSITTTQKYLHHDLFSWHDAMTKK